MGCCVSSPHAKRVYRDPGDLDEETVPLRYFGQIRSGSNLVPDDIGGLPSTHILQHLSTNANLLLYEAELDHGYSFRCFRPAILCLFTPWGLLYMIGRGKNILSCLNCDEVCCWVRKEYSTRSFFRVYPNRIMFNHPKVRIPWAWFGCGSWSADSIQTNPFDRGAFGFQPQNCGSFHFLCCTWPTCGGTIVRQRCQCNGPMWNRMFTDCGGCWCDEWPCTIAFCTYSYAGLANPDEAAFACSIALQAYFEERIITKEDMDKCIEFWRERISEELNPIQRKRSVCCEPYFVPCPECSQCYALAHPQRSNPYHVEDETQELKEVYEKYEEERQRQIKRYNNFQGPVRQSTLCRAAGCRRFFGRKGLCFCTEQFCSHFDRKAGDPAPPIDNQDVDDYFDASTVLMKVVGPPPRNVVIRRWRWDVEKGEHILETYAHESVKHLLMDEAKLHDS